MNKLLTIYDSFEVEKGTVATGRNDEKEIEIKVGSKVKIITPGNKEYILEIIEVEPFTKCFTNTRQLGILFGNQIKAKEIPRESELWQ